MAEISASVAYNLQQQQLSLTVRIPADLLITQIRGFIYVPAPDNTYVLRLISRNDVSVQDGAAILTFPKVEVGPNIEFQIMGLDSTDEILAGRRGYSHELLNFARIGIELTKV